MKTCDRHPCLTCEVRALARLNPAIKRFHDLLLDELTIAKMRQEALDSGRPVPTAIRDRRNNRDRQIQRAVRDLAYWSDVQRALDKGPMQLRELAEIIYGRPQGRLTAANIASLATHTVCRLVDRGLIVRVKRGWYALPSLTEGMRPPTTEDLRRMLRRGPMTAKDIAIEFDLSDGYASRLVKKLIDSGEPVRWEDGPGKTHPVRRWWMEGATPVRRSAA